MKFILVDNALQLVSEKIQQSEWYQYQPQQFDYGVNRQMVEAVCNHNPVCYMDSLNWTLMNKTPLTESIYKWIAYRSHIAYEGVTTNFLPHHLDFIHFIVGGR